MRIKTVIKLVLKNIKCNKKKLIFNICCFALSLINILLLVNLSSSYSYTVERKNTQLYGNQDAIIWDADENTAEKLLSDSAVSEIGTVSVSAAYESNNSLIRDNISVGCLDEKAMSLAQPELVIGRFPKNTSEAVVEEALAKQLNLSEGTYLEINAKDYNTENQETKKFQIVGICKDYSHTQSGGENSGLYYSLPNIITTNEENFICRHLLLTVNSEKFSVDEIYYRLVEYAGGNEQVYFKNYGIETMSFSATDSNALSLNYLFIILIAVAVFTTVLSLYLNVKSMKESDSAQIKLLKLSGASVSDINIYFFIRQIIILLLSVPIAAVFSLLLFLIIKDLILTKLIGVFYIKINSFISLTATAAATILFYIFGYFNILKSLKAPPLDTKKYKINRKSKLLNKNYNIKNPELLIGAKSVLFYGKKLTAVFLLISVSITFFVSGQIISNALVRDLSDDIVIDYKIEEYNGAFVSSLEIPLSLDYGISEKDLFTVRENPELDVITAMKQFRANIVTDKVLVSNSSFYLEGTSSADKAALNSDKREFGYSDEEYLMPSRIVGVDNDFLTDLNKYVIEGELNIEDLASGNSIAVIKEKSTQHYKVGDKIVFSQVLLKDPDNALQTGAVDGTRYDKEFTVSAVIDLSNVKEQALYEIKQVTRGFLTVNSAFDSLPFKTNYCNVFANLKDSDKFKKAEDMMINLKDKYPEINILSKRGEAYQLKLLTIATQSVCQFIMWTMLAISLFSLYEMIKQKINEQKKSYAILRAMGYSYKKLIFTEFAELFIFELMSILIGFLISFAICFIFNKYSYISVYPWEMLLISSILLIIATISIVSLPLRKIYKHNITDLLK